MTTTTKWCKCVDCTCNSCHYDDTCDCMTGWGVCTCKNCNCKDKNNTVSCACCDEWCRCGDCGSCTTK